MCKHVDREVACIYIRVHMHVCACVALFVGPLCACAALTSCVRVEKLLYVVC